MVADTQQLAAIYEEIKNVFSHHPSISVKPTKGNPPEQYEATYTIQGIYKDDSGRIQHSTHHVVSITIPFGFPHFPPSCKPITPIFHPDFDPAAICLGDFWQHDRSLSELVLYIGKMIAGEIYSRENTFNENAALWYRENSEKLPFARVEGVQETVPAPSAKSDTLDESMEIDTLEDDDFTSDFNLLGIDHEKGAKPASASPVETAKEKPPEFDSETIWLLSRQKRFFQLRDILKNLSDDVFFEGKDDLATVIKDSIKEAKTIYTEGEELEHRGLPAKALEKFRHVEDIVSDYPKIQEDIRRTEQAKDLLGDWVQGGEQSPAEPQQQTKNGKKIDRSPSGSPSSADTGVTMYSEKHRKQINVVPFAILIGITVVISPLLYIYFSNSNQYKRAEQLYSECTEQLGSLKFKEASQSCGAAITLAKEVTFIKKQESTELLGKLDSILNSEEMRQGLSGNVLVNGNYIPIALAESLKNSEKHIKEGDAFAAASDWDKAIASYALVLEGMQKDPKIAASIKDDLTNKISRAQVNLSIQQGTSLMEKEKCQQALEHFQKAIAAVQSLPSEEKKTYLTPLQHQIDTCTFLLLKQQGEEKFASANWTEAFSLFQKAIQLGTKLDQSEATALNSIQADAARAGLYSTINEGKLSFANKNWDEAIRKYANASKILMDNPGLLSKSETDSNLKKLSRIMLQASIIRDQEQADQFIAAKNYEDAGKRLQQILITIDESSFENEKEIADFKKTARDLLSKIKIEQQLSEKIAYLEQNYQSLFAQNYPVASQDSLSSPVITFVKEEKGKMLFRMQCTENGRGKPFTLVMFYSFDKKAEKWSFYSTADK